MIMKKMVPVFLAAGLVLIGFQNCSQSTSGESSLSNSSSSLKIEDPVLAEALSIDIMTQQNQSVSLDLKTGEMKQDLSGVVVKKCLPDSVRAEILDVLQNSNLCEYPAPASESICLQVYSPAYAEIFWTDKAVKVGEMYSSCHKDIDLCGQDSQLLRGLLRNVVSRWNEWSCDFKIVSK
jgi:hypothetical protein